VAVAAPKILIIDDDHALLEALPEALRLRIEGVVVDTVDSASSALDVIRTTPYDAFICDVKMPGMDGLTLLEEMRKLQPDTVTLLITGHGQHDLAVQALRRGAYDFIQKPIDRDYLIASLNHAIQTRNLSRAIKEQRAVVERHAGELEEVVQQRAHELVEANLAKAQFLEARDQALAKAEIAQRRLTLLAETSRLLAASLDYRATLPNVTRLAVPMLADWCVLDQIGQNGALHQLAAAHADHTKGDLPRKLDRHASSAAEAPYGPASVVRTGLTEVVSDVSNAVLEALAPEAAHRDLLRDLGFGSYLCVPLMTRNRVLGAITFASRDPRRRFDAEDIALAQDFARRCAVAIDNAQLYQAAQAELTERKQAEERYRLLIEGVKDYAIFMVDNDGRVAGWNSGAKHIFGYRIEEITDRHVSGFYTQEDAQRGRPATELALAARHGRFADDGWRVRKDGSRFWANTVTTRMCSDDGRIVGYSQITRDLTERKRAEEELLKAGKLESVGVLAAGIAHDFNNILSTLVSNLYLAKESMAPDDPRFKRLTEAERAIRRAQDLTHQLLTFSKGSALIRRQTDVGELLRVSSTFAVQGSPSCCEFSIPSTLWPVDVDEGQISQVIHNLVINAHQAMPDGGTILIRAENATVDADHHIPLPEGRYVRIVVGDTGIGIPEEHRAKIFDPFFTTKPKGTGLGLSTSYWIVKRHEGHITVESEVGRGSTFSVYLPASPTTAEAGGPAVKEGAILPGSGRILLMDDEASIREPLVQILAGLGYTITPAADGAAAIDLYRRALGAGQPYDVVILDLTVPGGMGGKEAVQRLRDVNPDVKVIVSSGYSDDPVIAQYRDHGFAGVVTKPFQISDLSELLRRIIPPANRPTHDPTPPV
jgi:PAS domain S-box-containing protein